MKVVFFYPGLVICLLIIGTRPLYAQEGFALTKIQLVGNQAFSNDALKKQLEMHTVNSFQRIILRKKPFVFSADVLGNGIERMTRFYQSEGFLYIKIDHELKVDRKRQRVELALKLHEGEPVLVNKVSTVLVADFSNHHVALQAIAQRRLRELALQPGTRFRDSSMRADQDSLRSSYMNAGYPYAQIGFALGVDQTQNRVGITWQIDPGPPCRFGATQVTGVKESLTRLVHRHLEFRQGETFNQSRIEKSQERIYGLGIFRVATMQAALGGRPDSTTVPIRVQVKEAPRLKAQFGIGYGTEDHFRAMADLQMLRFPSGARRLNLLAKHSGLEPYNLSLTNTNNGFLARNTSLITSIFLRRQDEEGFDVERRGGSLTLGRRFGFYTNGYVAYNLETVDDKQAENEETRAADEPSNYNKSAIATGVKLDNSTPIFTPKRGTYATAFFTVSGLASTASTSIKRCWRAGAIIALIASGCLPAAARSASLHHIKMIPLFPARNDSMPEARLRYAAGAAQNWARLTLIPATRRVETACWKSARNGVIRWRAFYPACFSSRPATCGANHSTIIFVSCILPPDSGCASAPYRPVRFDIARPIFEQERQTNVSRYWAMRLRK
jgi:outer membrane protein insertion porin family